MDASVAARNSETLIIVFAKYPRPGRVKTRLVGKLTERQSAAIHAACLRHTMRVVRQMASADRWLAASPDNADFSAYAAGCISVRAQGSGNLGERLARIAGDAFACGYRRVAVVGCDCPTMTPQDLASAFDGLERHDVMIGPALDGGYYLIAMRRFAAALFEGIDWGSAEVYAQTVRQAKNVQLSVGDLRARSDLDRPDDLRRLLADDGGAAETTELRDDIRTIIEEGDARGSEG
ncbi:MAG: TIGR04282 family arsenosugar biosynthesis glycosyltransferase [Phycisphaerales bacterium]|nr:TIGR04282 family arsenosugar biosynthesis glycosyltransferase [Phycisphaerales bacterium]MCB9854058.1 TIGR04282 family arsenosugar biosynthesis glycosyltransferase [Phycisphaerales bacterium]MCB9864368.1 TIGR04282 family arsenosugar biosynthesis glycosyltransferase [Phycisphaerales bacterium]